MMVLRLDFLILEMSLSKRVMLPVAHHWRLRSFHHIHWLKIGDVVIVPYALELLDSFSLVLVLNEAVLLIPNKTVHEVILVICFISLR